MENCGQRMLEMPVRLNTEPTYSFSFAATPTGMRVAAEPLRRANKLIGGFEEAVVCMDRERAGVERIND